VASISFFVYWNIKIIATDKANIPIASAIPAPMIAYFAIFSSADGFLAIASNNDEKIIATAMAAPAIPMLVAAIAKYLNADASIIIFLLVDYSTNL
jgi:hypothetical protein